MSLKEIGIKEPCFFPKKANNLLRNVCKTVIIDVVGWVYKIPGVQLQDFEVTYFIFIFLFQI